MRAMADYRCYRCGKLDGVELRGIPCYDCRDGRSATFWRDMERDACDEYVQDDDDQDDEDEDDDEADDEDDEWEEDQL